MLERFRMEGAKSAPASMFDNIDNLFERAMTSQAGQNSGHGFLYRELAESLLYINTHTGEDIIFTVNVTSRFVGSILQVHWCAAKRVLRYSASTTNHGILNTNVRGDENGRARDFSGL